MSLQRKPPTAQVKGSTHSAKSVGSRPRRNRRRPGRVPWWASYALGIGGATGPLLAGQGFRFGWLVALLIQFGWATYGYLLRQYGLMFAPVTFGTVYLLNYIEWQRQGSLHLMAGLPDTATPLLVAGTVGFAAVLLVWHVVRWLRRRRGVKGMSQIDMTSQQAAELRPAHVQPEALR